VVAAFPASAGVGSSVGDALHLLKNFLIETAQEERAGGGAREIPTFVLAPGIEFGGAALHVPRDFGGHEAAVLVAALVRVPFDVEVDPSADRITIGRAVGCDGGRRGPRVIANAGWAEVRRRFVQRDARKPGFAIECTAVGDGEHDVIPRARGDEAEMQAGPIA
jgi:hypothetical protein